MGSVENLSDEDAREIINAIVERSVKPDYMVKQRKTLRQILHYYTYETKVILSHYFGAKYIIPSLSIHSFISKVTSSKVLLFLTVILVGNNFSPLLSITL